jgi:hypothetical protein
MNLNIVELHVSNLSANVEYHGRNNLLFSSI